MGETSLVSITDWKQYEYEQRIQLGMKPAQARMNTDCADVNDLAYWRWYERNEYRELVEIPQRTRR